jgi:Winged helix DNA-binding domain
VGRVTLGRRSHLQIDIVGQRLLNQKLVRSDLKKPVEIVSWLGAVQSQDYTGAKWALALRAPALTDADLDRAFDRGDILRTHILRPTWHFVAPKDIRWMLALTAPRVLASNRHYCRKNGLDDKSLARCRRVMERALVGGRHLTRAALAAVLERAGIAGAGQRLAYLVMDAELERVICSGPRLGKQFTYALLEERAPKTRALTNDEALAELTKRYFASHGPATLRDFVWWSGLTVKLAKSGLDMLGRAVDSEAMNGLTYWSVPPARVRRSTTPAETPIVHLLPNYDELMNALRDRGLFRDPVAQPPADAFLRFPHQLAIDGILRGAWRRTLTNRGVTITVRPFRLLAKPEKRALDDAVSRYGRFANTTATLAIA